MPLDANFFPQPPWIIRWPAVKEEALFCANLYVGDVSCTFTKIFEPFWRVQCPRRIESQTRRILGPKFFDSVRTTAEGKESSPANESEKKPDSERIHRLNRRAARIRLIIKTRSFLSISRVGCLMSSFCSFFTILSTGKIVKSTFRKKTRSSRS